MDGGGKQLSLAGGNVGWQAVVEARVVVGARRPRCVVSVQVPMTTTGEEEGAAAADSAPIFF